MNVELRRRLERLAATVVLDELQRIESVEVAVALVAAGDPSSSGLALAMMPLDDKLLRHHDVEPLVRSMLEELGVRLPSVPVAAWCKAEMIATAMLSGAMHPVTGADRLWRLWDLCDGDHDELISMLPLVEAWEAEVRPRSEEIEADIVAHAAVVLAAARQRAVW